MLAVEKRRMWPPGLTFNSPPMLRYSAFTNRLTSMPSETAKASMIDPHRYSAILTTPVIGQVYNAKVEFSPYQKTASAPRKVDQRQGTIEEGENVLECFSVFGRSPFALSKEPDYQRFLELLKSPTDAVANTSNPSATVPQTTPLIEHLRAQRKAAVAAASKRHASAKSAASGGKTAPQIAKRAGKSAAQSSQKISVPPTASHEAVKKLSSAPGADRTATLASSDPQQPATQSPRKGKSGRQGKGQRPLAGDAAAAEGSKPARSPSAPPPKGKKGREGKKESQHREATKPIRDTAASTSTQAVEAPSVDQRRPDDSGGPSRQRRLPEGPPARPGTLGVEAANAGSGAQEAAPRPRRGDVQDSAGARRRLGNALAGIGAAAERRKARQPSTAAPVPNEGTGQASKS